MNREKLAKKGLEILLTEHSCQCELRTKPLFYIWKHKKQLLLNIAIPTDNKMVKFLVVWANINNQDDAKFFKNLHKGDLGMISYHYATDNCATKYVSHNRLDMFQPIDKQFDPDGNN